MRASRYSSSVAETAEVSVSQHAEARAAPWRTRDCSLRSAAPPTASAIGSSLYVATFRCAAVVDRDRNVDLLPRRAAVQSEHHEVAGRGAVGPGRGAPERWPRHHEPCEGITAALSGWRLARENDIPGLRNAPSRPRREDRRRRSSSSRRFRELPRRTPVFEITRCAPPSTCGQVACAVSTQSIEPVLQPNRRSAAEQDSAPGATQTPRPRLRSSE